MQVLDVEVELSPNMDPGPFDRCICFNLYETCDDGCPVSLCEVLTFGGEHNYDGHAHAELQIEAGQYVCIEAWDPLHTLRAKAAMEWDGAKWVAIFKGDPYFGGNWLTGGNLDGNNVIDTEDYDVFVAELGTDYGTGDTTCQTEPPHADLNGDGVVDDLDFSLISVNLDEVSDGCCPGQTDADDDGVADSCDNCPNDFNPSQSDLDLDGIGDACDPDIDGDGVLNEDDACPFTLPGAAVDPQGRPLGDIDEDCDTDLEDMSLFQQGFTGPGEK